MSIGAAMNRQIELESGALSVPPKTGDGVPGAPLHKEPVSALLSIIAEAARDPRVDAAKMRELWELKKSIDTQEAEIAFNYAMMSTQAEMRPVVRDAINPQTHSKYAKLEKIDKVIKPIYIKHGFSLSFNSDVIEAGKVIVSCLCMHSGGHSKPYSLPGPLDLAGLKGSSNKSEMHALGSSLSYLKRYLKCMIFDVTLTDEDDDAAATEEYLDQEQKNKILDLILACQDAEPQIETHFLKFLGAKDLNHIPARQFVLAINTLQAKYRKVKGS